MMRSGPKTEPIRGSNRQRTGARRFFKGGLRLAALATCCWGIQAQALTFNIVYDSSVTSLGNAAQVEAAFATATQAYSGLFSNVMTINLVVYWGPVGPFTNGVQLGESQTLFHTTPAFAYTQLTNALFAARKSADDSNSVASLPASNPASTNKWWVPRAELKALRMLIATNDTNVDGDITFASDQPYTFDPTNRAVAGKFDFIGVAEHEISEVMGRNYVLDFGLDGFGPFDLFRFTNGVRSFGVHDQNVYFSVNNGVTALKNFYGDINTGDIQDWQTSNPQDSYDALVTTGKQSLISAADITVLDILGYNLAPVSAPHLTAARQSNGSIQISFTNVPFTSFSVLASTNAALAVTNWTVLGTASEPIAGHYQYTDSNANKWRFYKVRTP